MGELLGLSPLPKEYKDLSTLRMPNVQAMQTKLVKADFHGSIMSGKFFSLLSYTFIFTLLQ